MPTIRPYPDYKDSGIPWLGDVPTHWAQRRLKTLVGLRAGDGITSESIESKGSFPVYGGNGIRGYSEEFTHSGTYALIGRQGALCGNVHLVEGTFWASEHAVVAVPKTQLEVSWLARTLRVMDLGRYSVSAAQPGIGVDTIRDLRMPLPPLEEQRAIAGFLDAMDAKISRFIAARRRMIALLEEQKQAIINQAVTRGLNPDVPLRPSGIDWLGDIPAHWEILPLGKLVSIAGGMTPNKSISGYWTGTMPWISPKDMKSSRITTAVDYISEQAVRETGLAIVPLQSILIVVRGMILARKVPVAVTDIPLTINQDMKALVPKLMIGSDFLARLLEAAQDALFLLIDEAGHGTRRLPTLALLGLQLPIPPEYEQVRIVAHIADAVSKISGTARRHLREIELIQEYRTRLISDVVTGNLDVRGVELPTVKEIIGEEIKAAMEEADIEELVDELEEVEA